MAKVIELQTMTAYKESLSSNGKKIAELLRRGGKFIDLIEEVQHVLYTIYYVDIEGKIYTGQSNVPMLRMSPFNDIGGNNSRLCYSKDAAQHIQNFCNNLQDRLITNVLRPLWNDYGAEILMRDISAYYFSPRISEDEYYQTTQKFEGDLFAMKCTRDLFCRTLAITNKTALLDKLFNDEPLRSFSIVRAGTYDFDSNGGYYNGTFQRAYFDYLASIEDDVFIPNFYHRSSNGEAGFFYSLNDNYRPYDADTSTETATLEDDLDAFVQALHSYTPHTYTL